MDSSRTLELSSISYPSVIEAAFPKGASARSTRHSNIVTQPYSTYMMSYSDCINDTKKHVAQVLHPLFLKILSLSSNGLFIPL